MVDDSFLIYIEIHNDGRVLEVRVRPNETILSAKRKLVEKYKLEMDQLKNISYYNFNLEDQKRFTEYNILSGVFFDV